MNREELIEKYNELKQEISDVRHDMTLSKYKILSKAYKIGKKIHGHNYCYLKLSMDFEVPYTTVKRVCSLDKANFNTWELINKKKITSFKVAQILQQHGPTFQDEIISLAIEKNLTTYDIRNFRSKTLKEVKESRLKIAISQGWTRKYSAYKSMKDAIDRMSGFTVIEITHLPENKIPSIKKDVGVLIKDMKKLEKKLSCSLKESQK